MNYTSESGEREIIKPSARESIHNHPQCPFKFIEMGRYGMHRLKRVNTSSSHDTSSQSNHICGNDEVDCIISKRSHSVSPSPKENKDAQQRNSLNFLHEKNIEDIISEDENMVAKSLPAELPSYLHYRDSYNQWTSEQCNETKNRSNESTISRECLEEYESMNSTQRETQDKTNMFVIIIILGSLALIAATHRAVLCLISTAPKENRIIYDEWKLYNDLNVLKDKYKINDNSILLLQTGISTIFKKEDTGSFVIVYNSKNNNFNQIKFYRFVNDVVSTAARYLRNESTSNHHIEIDSSSLDMHTHSELIHKYRNDLMKSGVMLVRELDRVPSNLAMAFHYYCDEYNPLVKKSAIFFTLNLENCSYFSGETSIYAVIEKCISKKWHGMPQDNITPLLTRVVSVVVDVTDVF